METTNECKESPLDFKEGCCAGSLMEEIMAGVFHWKTFHEGIQAYVHSYFVEVVNPAILIDPRVPAQGLRWFDAHRRPEHVYLTNRHHYRHSGRFAERFGCKVWCHRAGLHEFTRGEEVTGFDHGDRLPGGVHALEVGVLCPEETALYLHENNGIVALGDSIVRDERGRLAFVPDVLMGDDPEAVKRGLHGAFNAHVKRKFDHLLLAHGKPQVGGAKKLLEHFLRRVAPA